MIAEFPVVEAFRAGGDDEKNGVARLQADRFRNLVGSTPCASAASATVAELASVSITVTSGDFSVKKALTDSIDMRIY